MICRIHLDSGTFNPRTFFLSLLDYYEASTCRNVSSQNSRDSSLSIRIFLKKECPIVVEKCILKRLKIYPTVRNTHTHSTWLCHEKTEAVMNLLLKISRVFKKWLLFTWCLLLQYLVLNVLSDQCLIWSQQQSRVLRRWPLQSTRSKYVFHDICN